MYMLLLQMRSQTELSLEEFEREGYNFEDLETIASDDNKVKFLKVLSNSQQLIDWLQRETRGLNSIIHTITHIIQAVIADVSELHNLIGLSMHEDNVCTMDRIAQLHTVGSAIAPLVYKLEADSGLSGFLKACEPVWKAIEVNPELLDSFVSCLDNLLNHQIG